MADGVNTGPFKTGPTIQQLLKSKSEEWESRPCATPDCMELPMFSKDCQKWCNTCYWKLRVFEDRKEAEAAETAAQAEQEAEVSRLEATRKEMVRAEMAKRQANHDKEVRESKKHPLTAVDVLSPPDSATTNDWEFGACPKCGNAMNVSEEEKRCWTCGKLIWRKEPEESDYLIMAGLMSAEWDSNDAGE